MVDDGIRQGDWKGWNSVHPNLTCVRTDGDSGFTAAVNSGLDKVETLGFRFVLVFSCTDAMMRIYYRNVKPVPALTRRRRRSYGKPKSRRLYLNQRRLLYRHLNNIMRKSPQMNPTLILGGMQRTKRSWPILHKQTIRQHMDMSRALLGVC